MSSTPDEKLEPEQSASDGSQKAEPAVGQLLPRDDLKNLMDRRDVADTVSGLAQYDPQILGGMASSVLLGNWLNQLCEQTASYEQTNRKLQEDLKNAEVEVAELRGEVKQLKSASRLREATLIGGSILLGASLGMYASAQGLAVVTGIVGAIFLVAGLLSGRAKT